MEDDIDGNKIKSLSYSYIYEEEQPHAAPNMFVDKQVCPSREDTEEIKTKNKIIN